MNIEIRNTQKVNLFEIIIDGVTIGNDTMANVSQYIQGHANNIVQYTTELEKQVNEMAVKNAIYDAMLAHIGAVDVEEEGA